MDVQARVIPNTLLSQWYLSAPLLNKYGSGYSRVAASDRPTVLQWPKRNINLMPWHLGMEI